jgi:hypothetical protein
MSLPAVVAHERHRGGNSTPLGIPVCDRSGPVTEIAGRVAVAVHSFHTLGTDPSLDAKLEIRTVSAATMVALGGGEPPVGHD